MSVDIADVITCATFCDDRLRGLGVAMGRISRFPIDLRRRPYNTLALPCECVIAGLLESYYATVMKVCRDRYLHSTSYWIHNIPHGSKKWATFIFYDNFSNLHLENAHNF